MYFWIVFPLKRKKKNNQNSIHNSTSNDSDPDDEDDLDEETMIRTELINISTHNPNDVEFL